MTHNNTHNCYGSWTQTITQPTGVCSFPHWHRNFNNFWIISLNPRRLRSVPHRTEQLKINYFPPISVLLRSLSRVSHLGNLHEHRRSLGALLFFTSRQHPLLQLLPAQLSPSLAWNNNSHLYIHVRRFCTTHNRTTWSRGSSTAAYLPLAMPNAMMVFELWE